MRLTEPATVSNFERLKPPYAGVTADLHKKMRLAEPASFCLFSTNIFDSLVAGFDSDDRMVNCYSNQKVDEVFVPQLLEKMRSRGGAKQRQQQQQQQFMDISSPPPISFDTASNLEFPPVEHLYDKNTGNVEVSIQPHQSSSSHNSSSDAIFALAENYDLPKFVHFLQTLESTGYSGDVVLSITSDHDDELINYLKSFKSKSSPVNVVFYSVVWDCTSKKNGEDLGSSTNGGVSDCLLNGLYKNTVTGKNYNDLRKARPVATARYELYYVWCKKYSPNSKIMLIDFRDTYFELNPFSSNEVGGLLQNEMMLFAEHNPSVTIRTSVFNKKWVHDCYSSAHLNSYGDNSVLCSGSTIGGQPAIYKYLTAMVFQFDATGCLMKGADQGFHNYIYYSNTLRGLGINERVFKQGEGIINNLAAGGVGSNV